MKLHFTSYISILIILICASLNAIMKETFQASMSAFEAQKVDTDALGRLPTNYTRNVCPTRNMSYDIRKNIPIKREQWNALNSTIGALNPNLCLSHGVD
jgi:hypothetical protein